MRTSASERNEIYNFFEEQGLPVIKWDFGSYDKSYRNYYKSDYGVGETGYPPNPDLDGFVIVPITLKDAITNDIYELRWKSDKKDWDIRNIKIENDPSGFAKLKKDEYNNLDFRLTLVQKGSSFVRGKLVERGKITISEFETLENFDDGEAPNYAEIHADDPLVSVAKPVFDIENLVESQLKQAEELLKKSKEVLEELEEAKELGQLEEAMWSVDEVDRLYNAKIDTDDKRAFLIWLQNKNEKKLIGEFAEKYGTEYPTPANEIVELMTKGKLFYVQSAPIGERLQPKVIYRSGNIWSKWSDLNQETNKEEFIKRFGEDIYNNHIEVLRPTWLETWERRLRLAPEDKNMRLVMLPISEMAKELKVEKFISVRDRDQIKENFKIYTSFSGGKASTDVLREEGYKRSNNFVDKKYISLQSAFLLWCKDAGSGEASAKFGVQWSNKTKNVQDLVDRYIKPTKNPYKKDKKKGEEKWAREKDDARKVGNRLFALFLEEGLDPKDQNKIEIIWNSTFNYYVDPVLDEVPIGFTYKKYLDNINLFALRDANLNALRYYLTRGSVGLAYGVGIGKTFCSIMVMKQALDLGLCKRPLVIVPNQVYFQFSREIQRGLGAEFDPTREDTRLNMFYNGSGNYNVLGNNAVDGINLCTYEASLNFEFEKDKVYDEENQVFKANWLERATRIYMQGNEELDMPNLLTKTLQKSKDTLFNDFEDDSDTSVDESKRTITDEDTGEVVEFKKGGKPKKAIEPIFLNSDSTDYDFVCVDEAHNFNALFGKVFSAVKSEQTDSDKINREKNPYSSIRETGSGKEASKRAEKLFWLTQYIQSKSQIKNTLLLSATPFTNSPTQVFSLLTMLNYEALEETSVGIMKDFYDLFAKVEYAEDFKTDLRIIKREKLTGWVNIIAMQKLVYRAFDKSSREDEDKAVVRPEKIVLPLKRREVENKVIELAQENHISTTIKLSQKQQLLWDDVRSYAQGGDQAKTYEQICSPENQNTTSLGKFVAPKRKKQGEDDEGSEIDIENPDELTDGSADGEKAKNGAKALQCLMWGRQLCLNPYLFKCSGYKDEPTPQQYVQASPKMLYTMECIRSVKEYHDNEGSLMSGQIIYMNFGVGAFPLMRDYLVEELGFDVNEIGIISGKGNYVGKKRYQNKVDVQDFFLGRKLDAETGKYSQIDDSKRVKILLGSEAIKEGINLQDYASVLYNVFLDFNPTDQVQVEGRIWRQGNAFANVRIVMPLMADCIDVFMFQKLADKTERINQLWTRNGNKNELDTTAFDPAELKYELMSDPVAIATLERENKSEKLDEEIVDETEVYSGYKSLENIFTKYEKVAFSNLNDSIRSNFIINGYYTLSQLRPDLITKPLLNQEGYLEYLKKAVKTEFLNEFSYKEALERYPTFADLQSHGVPSTFWGSALCVTKGGGLRTSAQLDTFRTLVNYTAIDIVDLMVLFNKQQKIAFPRGYSKNWREIVKPFTMPIYDFDEVEYDTKKGRKKGIAEFVLNVNGGEILDEFQSDIQDLVDGEEVLEKATDKLIKSLKLKAIPNVKALLDLPNATHKEDIRRDLSTLMKSMMKQFPKEWEENDYEQFFMYGENELVDRYRPQKLDIGDLEELSIEGKNVVKVDKDEAKMPKPTKYPEPYTWTNKDALESLIDSAEFQDALALDDSKKYLLSEDVFNVTTNNILIFFQKQALENKLFIPIGRDYYWKCQAPYIIGYDSSNGRASEGQIDGFYKDHKTWIELQEVFEEQAGVYYNEYQQWYFNKYPRDLAEYKLAYKDKLEPNELFTKSDVQIKLNESQEKINSFKLEQRNLFDKEVFEELVEEVIRRQQALAEEDIREGNSFRARAVSFATPNPEYLGNDYLSIFAEDGKARTMEDVEEAEVISEEQQEILNDIEALETAMKYETKAEQKITKADIEALKLAYQYS